MQPTHPVEGAGPVSALVSCSYYKLQPTGHLKTTELYSLSSIGQKSEIKVLAGPCPRQALRQKPSCTSVVASGSSMCSLACGCLTPILVISVCLPLFFFFFFLIISTFNYYLFIYLFLAVLGLRFCARAFSSCGKRGPLFIAVRGPLTIAATSSLSIHLMMDT